MAWTDPTTPNLADFFTYAYSQGIPSASIPLPVLTVTNGGSGYTSAPNVTIAGPSVGLAMTATATVSGGIVTALTPVSPGTNYGSIPTLTIDAPTSGTQATGVVTSLASIYPAAALNKAIDITINSTGGASLTGELTSYVRACYNIGFHTLLIIAQDVTGSTFFQTQRTAFNLNQFRPGVMLASGDQGTSQTFIVPKFFQEITMEGLDATKTPWGRSWIAYEQQYGYTVWGMS